MANRNTKRNRLAWSKAARKLVNAQEEGSGLSFVSAYCQVRDEARHAEGFHPNKRKK